ncbi:UDP-N-acetylmuramate dehydrogenase [Corynebacterium cystitidis]|uniref:UDP-N-acetylenolpyruvoylglucosamine reductase n=2 Tax=Corynebacterium cystitidis TaxID=35757 RepID=A0A1H9VZR3_9CORY|nr:UDP-N-acetylmuramate dehydrogenase [Corynebacterium cystitidis]WJY81343.1 UDP-N-acetylenolpyruvoylglucosamine reductase [Corynebacterium cystitidis DSM 20524]SES27132.1 UDP-N-acetylmuramate dehydrogenase [Corynebacterium cystitidis DSM 20524]SNV88245.1 UDP-N-acetylenolpyruvoylglucosamine reductase [Corynebacterium cystitidis]
MSDSSQARIEGQVLASVLATLTAIDGIMRDDDFTFAQATTLHVGGTPVAAVRAETSEALAAAVQLLDEHCVDLLVVGGGSNLVVADGQLDLVAVVAANDAVTIHPDGVVNAEAGVVWDELVAATVEEKLAGIEVLSGIPGSVGAVPVQNVGAYGAEIADVLRRVKLYNRETCEVEWVDAAALELSYRFSNLKFTNRAVVLEVELQLDPTGVSIPLRHMDNRQVPVAEARESVLEQRRGKGMVLDPGDHDTWSAGSFFTNPIVEKRLADEIEAKVGEESMPRFPQDDGREKLSAAWLIERAGFARGYPGEGAPVRLSTKHTLAITNRGQAKAADVRALARQVRAGVEEAFGVRLVPEPVWVRMDIG